MHYCPFCSADLEMDARFCSECGKRIPDYILTPPPNFHGGGSPQPLSQHLQLQRRRRGILWAATVVAIVVALALTTWRLASFWARSENKASQEAQQRGATTPKPPARSDRQGDGSTSKPQDIQEKAGEVVGDVFGRDGKVGELKMRAPSLDSGLKETEASDGYQLTAKDCTKLFTDVMQQAGVAIGQEIAVVTAISAKEENKIGEELTKEIAKKFKGKIDLGQDRASLEYLKKVGLYMAKGANRDGIGYNFHVIRDDVVNAFAIPGGGVYVFTGLLDKLDNEAQLAGVLAHEIAHVDQRHCVGIYQVLSRLPGAAKNPFAFVAAQMVRHPFQSRVEADADRRGLELIYEVGYSPYQLVRFWEKQDWEYMGQNPEGKQSKQGSSSSGGKSDDVIGAILGEVAKEAGNVINDHPEAEKRACLLRNHILHVQNAVPREVFYVGRWNLSARKPFFEEMR